MKRIKTTTLLALVVGLALVAPTPTMAAFIDGSQLNINGAGTVGATFLNFQCVQPGDPACATAPPGTGDFAVANSTLSFAQYNGTFGLIKSINNAAQPLNMSFSLPNFITFSLNNNITIELTFIPLGTNTPSSDCIGLAHCTPQNNLLITGANPQGLSAFNLDQNFNGTSAVFGVYGIAHGSDGSAASLAGTFTTPFNGLNPAQALVAALQGSQQTYASQLNLTVVPEPATSVFLGIGLIGLGILTRRHKRS